MPVFALLLLLAVDIAPSNPDLAYQQPQIASDGRDVGIVFGARNTIYYAHNEAPPVTVAEAPVLSLGNHRGPRLAFTADAIVITAGVGPAGQQYAPNTLRSWRSTDHGKTWNAGPDISTPGTGGMGFQAVGSDGKRRLFAAWIGPQNGAPRLFVAHSDDSGTTWSKQTVLSQTVCECCHPTVTISDDGTVRILFRNSLDGNRDFYLATARDGEHFEIAKLGQGSWKLDACPMDGGGMGEFDGAVTTLWRRKSDLFLATPGEPEEQLATGHNAAVALRKDGVYAVWSDGASIMAKVPGKAPYVLSKSGGFPALTARGPVVAAWEDNGRIRTERLGR
ncbi:MAG TPA: sialidase family protein [Bryobacteraceae bacterium]|nr:sialidase family protein [Bryobacteraceae bacterium]